MTLDDFRATVTRLLSSSSATVRLYGRTIGVAPAFVESIIPALGTISVDEACDAIDREALAQRGRVIAEGRAADA